MRWAIVALNTQTVIRGLAMKKVCEDLAQIDVYTLPKYLVAGTLPIEGKLKSYNQELFRQYKVMIYIMAMGIIVRDVTPYLKHKSIDPAVLCLSPDGQYLIPVLSGHLGGANKIARFVSERIGARPVITTASDLMKVRAVDLLAKSHGLVIDNYGDAKLLTAMMINHEPVDILSDIFLTGVETVAKPRHEAKGIVHITHKTDTVYKLPVAKLIPRNIVIGMGVRRGVPYQEINKFLNVCLRAHHISRKAIGCIASIDLKQDELGILALVESCRARFVTYDAPALCQVEHLFEQSDFVRKITGVGAVAMPSGYLASGKGTCVAKKMASNGITISIWEERK